MAVNPDEEKSVAVVVCGERLKGGERWDGVLLLLIKRFIELFTTLKCIYLYYDKI